MNETPPDFDVSTLSEGLFRIDLRVPRKDEVYLRALLEAYDGLAVLIGSGEGIVRLATPPCQAKRLRAFLADLASEIHMLPLEP